MVLGQALRCKKKYDHFHFYRSLLLMFKDQEPDWNSILDRYIEDLLNADE